MEIKEGDLEKFENSERFNELSDLLFTTLGEMGDLNLAIQLITKECKDEKELFFCGMMVGKSIPFFQGLIKDELEW